MNSIKKVLAFTGLSGIAAFASATPVVSNVTMAQDPSRQVTITYKLSEPDAVVTLDVLTNATPFASTGWTSIGGQAICTAQGAVWRKVTSADADAQGRYTITWHPDLSWRDGSGNGFKIANGCAKVVVTAWALDNTPDYMVVDISEGAQQNTQKYYTSTNCLPGGLFGNPDYRTTKLVMRKIMAKDVEWTMGSTTNEIYRTAANEGTHLVSLTNNYYIGVFEITQTQWGLIQAARPFPSRFNNVEYRQMRPVEQVCYNEIRNAANTMTADTTYDWPHDPNPGSFLGLLRNRTGIDFDLPSEAQWEFAARAGNGDTKWGDGSRVQNRDDDPNLLRMGRCAANGGKVNNADAPANSTADNGTAVVGSYAPNAWGLYDTAGNVLEWCLDWFEADISAYGGKVNIDPEDSQAYRSGTEVTTKQRVKRGGASYLAGTACRPACRSRHESPASRTDYYAGFRVVCTAGLK